MTNIDDVLYAPIQWGRPDDPDRIQHFECQVTNYFPNLSEPLSDVLEQYLFELNNAPTRRSVVESVSGLLARQEGLRDYRVVCDETNNGAETIAKHELNVDIWLKPGQSVDVLYFRAKLGESV